MDLEKMNLDELNVLIKMASAAKERKIRAEKDVKWAEFSKAWHKIFSDNDDIEIGYESYSLPEIFEGLKEVFYY